MSRYIQIRFDGQALVWFLHEGNELRATRVENGLPPSAHFVQALNEPSGTLSLVFEHESFPEAPEGETPVLCPVFRDIAAAGPWDGSERRVGYDRRRGPSVC